MSDEVKPQQMSVDDLALLCAQETDLYFKQKVHDTRYCFELFRRAIEEGSKAAWDLICIQYDALVTGWVTRHYGFASSGAEAQDFVNEAFRKIFSTITAEKFGRFSDLGALLGYLKLCVHSVIVDFTRATDYAKRTALDNASKEKSAEPSPEEQAIEQSERRTLWELLETRLHDRKERLVIYGSFVLDQKPQELIKHYQGEFSDVGEIYRIKQNVITRLRRDLEFRNLLGFDD